jgi:hypothetical protein
VPAGATAADAGAAAATAVPAGANAADAGAAAKADGGGSVIYTEEMLADLAKRREKSRRPNTLSAYMSQYRRLDSVSHGRIPCLHCCALESCLTLAWCPVQEVCVPHNVDITKVWGDKLAELGALLVKKMGTETVSAGYAVCLPILSLASPHPLPFHLTIPSWLARIRTPLHILHPSESGVHDWQRTQYAHSSGRV